VANEKEFQDQIRQLGKLVAQFDELPESSAKLAGKELVQLLMEVHGRGLERVMEVVFDSAGAGQNVGQKIIDQLGQDSVVGSLLLLYSLHPDGLEVRVENALERIRPSSPARSSSKASRKARCDCGSRSRATAADRLRRICAPSSRMAFMNLLRT